MGETHYGNAMTEVALALAMAFFSIMILAVVSMGAAHIKAVNDDRQKANTSIAAKLAPSKNSSPSAETAATQDDTLIIYHKGTVLAYGQTYIAACTNKHVNTVGNLDDLYHFVRTGAHHFALALDEVVVVGRLLDD